MESLHVHYPWCDTRPFSLTLLSTYLDQLENGLGLGQMEHEHGKGQSTWDTDIDGILGYHQGTRTSQQEQGRASQDS